jgi:hypothetical protein
MVSHTFEGFGIESVPSCDERWHLDSPEHTECEPILDRATCLETGDGFKCAGQDQELPLGIKIAPMKETSGNKSSRLHSIGDSRAQNPRHPNNASTVNWIATLNFTQYRPSPRVIGVDFGH